MKIFLLMIFSFFIVSCGNGSGVIVQTKTDFFEFMWNINPNSFYYQDKKVVRGADINLTSAWKHSRGDGVKVAIIDDCFDALHEDLKDNIYLTHNINTGQTDVYFSSSNQEGCHGTEVAGVLAGVDNGFGIIGVAPKVELILISIDLENSFEDDFIKAFEYAKKHGAKIISCSWGSNNESQAFHNELRDIKNQNIITIFASGNDDLDLDENGYNDESEDENVIGVGATDENNDVAYYSNYGSNIDVLAPGGNSIGIYTTQDSNQYNTVVGTSFSAPTVSGVVALKLSLNPNLTFDEIRSALINTTDKVGQENNANYINGFDKYRAYGKINAGNFINY